MQDYFRLSTCTEPQPYLGLSSLIQELGERVSFKVHIA